MDRSSKFCVMVAALCVAVVLAWAELSRAQAGADARGGAAAPAAGTPCKVYLRGDAAGVAWHDRVVDLNSLLIQQGTYAGSDESWVTIRSNGKELWIPRGSIMLIEISK